MPKASKIFVQCLTGSRLVFAVLAAVFILLPERTDAKVVAALVFVILNELTDLLDGFAARRLGAVSEFGKMFDPYADSVSRLIIFWSLGRAGLCWQIVFLVMAVRDVTVSYVRIHLTRLGRDVSARFSGKAKAIIQAVGAIILVGGPLYWGDSAAKVISLTSVAVIAVTALSMIDYLAGAVRATRPDQRADNA